MTEEKFEELSDLDKRIVFDKLFVSGYAPKPWWVDKYCNTYFWKQKPKYRSGAVFKIKWENVTELFEITGRVFAQTRVGSGHCWQYKLKNLTNGSRSNCISDWIEREGEYLGSDGVAKKLYANY